MYIYIYSRIRILLLSWKPVLSMNRVRIGYVPRKAEVFLKNNNI